MATRSVPPSSATVLLPTDSVVDELDASALIDLATQAARVQARAMARLAALGAERSLTIGAGDYLTVDEAAALLRVTPEWVYRKASAWPFANKLAPKVLRIQRVGLLRWIEQRSRR